MKFNDIVSAVEFVKRVENVSKKIFGQFLPLCDGIGGGGGNYTTQGSYPYQKNTTAAQDSHSATVPSSFATNSEDQSGAQPVGNTTSNDTQAERASTRQQNLPPFLQNWIDTNFSITGLPSMPTSSNEDFASGTTGTTAAHLSAQKNELLFELWRRIVKEELIQAECLYENFSLDALGELNCLEGSSSNTAGGKRNQHSASYHREDNDSDGGRQANVSSKSGIKGDHH
ncbi:unnamed protein product, partial [Amoebophrya sp. A120]|eukprot:GSA120T00020755001.1